MRAIFLDRDGTINAGIPKYERVDSVDKVEILPTVLEALEELSNLDYKVFFVTNQAGLAEGLISRQQFEEINNHILGLIRPSHIEILETYVCPHGENEQCQCRKPRPKMLHEAAEKYGIDLKNSWMVGDRASDVMTGVNAGTKTILVKSGVASVSSDEADYTAESLLDAVRFIASSEAR